MNSQPTGNIEEEKKLGDGVKLIYMIANMCAYVSEGPNGDG
jgi:hypothetical protein